MMTLKHSEVTEKVIKAFFNVYNALGSGFLESVYHNAMVVELRRQGLSLESERAINVYYRGGIVGQFFADIVVEDCVIIELKAVRELAPEHHAQLYNYLKASHVEVGLLMNFGREPEYQRKFCANAKPQVTYGPRPNQGVVTSDPLRAVHPNPHSTNPNPEKPAVHPSNPLNPPNPL